MRWLGPFLTTPEKEESCALLKLHMSTYQYLACGAARRGELNYRIRPKNHYTAHLEEWVRVTGWNPQARSTFIDEDHMKALAAIASRLHPRTLCVQFPRRCSLKRVLSWSEGRKSQQLKKLKTDRGSLLRNKRQLWQSTHGDIYIYIHLYIYICWPNSDLWPEVSPARGVNRHNSVLIFCMLYIYI